MTADNLSDFLDEVLTDSHLRVETDLGDGFVRLRSSEAERRQAAQDIRSSEDILIELLRNSRDAHARHIFVATQKEGSERRLIVIDDGDGVPAHLHESIFEPRVTSKLDSAHMDKWGMHGRGMALYSIAVNAQSAHVKRSFPSGGTSIEITTDTASLPEKTDQSTFPHFEQAPDKSVALRGPKNLLRTTAEFALEHRHDCTVYLGSPVEIAAALYAYGTATLSPAMRAFRQNAEELPLVKTLALATDDHELADLCAELGLGLSARSARRIMQRQVAPPDPLINRLETEMRKALASAKHAPRKTSSLTPATLKLTSEDRQAIEHALEPVIGDLAERYYLEEPRHIPISVHHGAIHITIPIERAD